MGIVVGLDCGGSSCRALAVDERGTVVFQGQSGPTNLASTPEPRIRRHLSNALRGFPAPDAVCGCFAGLVNEEQRVWAKSMLAEHFPRAQVRAEPDYAAAFRAAPVGTNVCIIAGTGSLVCSQIDGNFVKSGGRGYILGDIGSAYTYGRDALIHFLDGNAPPSRALLNAIDVVFGTRVEGELIAAVYQSPTPAGTLAKLAKALGEDARNGEAYAVESVERNTKALLNVVTRHVEKWGIGPDLRFCLTGGIWKGTPFIREEFERLIRRQFGDQVKAIDRTVRPPVHGAVDIARDMINGN